MPLDYHSSNLDKKLDEIMKIGTFLVFQIDKRSGRKEVR